MAKRSPSAPTGVKATLDSQGGSLVRLELLTQADQNDRSEERRAVRPVGQAPVPGRRPGLIPPAGGAGLPNHRRDGTVPGDLARRQQRTGVRFESPEVGGVKMKVYAFRRGDYAVGVRHEVINRLGRRGQPALYLQLVRDGNNRRRAVFFFTFTGPAIFTDARQVPEGRVQGSIANRAKPDHATSGRQRLGRDGAALLRSPGCPTTAVRSPREFYTGKVDANTYSVGGGAAAGRGGARHQQGQDAQLFAGPQEENKLAALAPAWNWSRTTAGFTILAEPLFWLLTKLHGLLGNWGWSIVALVVLLKIAFYWLNASAYRSMAKMKAINPRVMELRERLKDKPQQMQQEMMRIYREEKVNPLGGCLPIVAQMPFFIALYWVLLSSVEMRNAPWIGWITDLSAIGPVLHPAAADDRSACCRPG